MYSTLCHYKQLLFPINCEEIAGLFYVIIKKKSNFFTRDRTNLYNQFARPTTPFTQCKQIRCDLPYLPAHRSVNNLDVVLFRTCKEMNF